jgi:phytoene dehydrogenase-like protein
MEKGAFRRFGFHPDGTIGLAGALAAVVERDGGQLWLESEVQRIHTSGGRVTGATIRRGSDLVEVGCDAVISDVGPVATIGLVGEEALGQDYVRAIRGRSRPAANMIIHIASAEPLLDAPGLVVFSRTERVCNAGNLTATCPELAPPGRHLTVAYAVPRPAVGAFDAERELELAIQELHGELPGMAGAEIVDARVMRGEMPAQRAAAGYEMPWQTPLENLWNVGDGVREYASGGLGACAETAREAVAAVLANDPAKVSG